MRTLIITAIAAVVLGVGLYFALYYTMPRYQSEYQLVVTPAQPDAFSPSNPMMVAQNLEAMSAFMRNQIFRLRSDDVISDALRQEDIMNTAWYRAYARGGEADLTRIRRDLQETLSANPIRGSTVISVTFRARVPEDAQRILNTVVNTYLQRARTDTGRAADDLRQLWTRELNSVDARLRDIQEEIRRFTIERDIPNLDARINDATIDYTRQAEQASRLRMDLQVANEIYAGLVAAQEQGNVAYSSEDYQQVRLDPAVRFQEDKLRSLRERREVLLGQFGTEHLEIVRIDRMIQAAEQEMQDVTDRLLRQRQEVKLEQAQRMKSALEGQLAGMQPRLEAARTRMSELQVTLNRYRDLEKQVEEARARRAQITTALDNQRVTEQRRDNFNVQTQFTATVPDLAFPKPQVVVPGVFVLLVGAVAGLIFLKEVLDQRVKSPEDVRNLGQADLLGVLPDTAEDPSGPSQMDGIVRKAPSGLMAEAFRQLRSTVLARLERDGHKSLLIVSPQAQGGASSVTSNLAASLATQNRRVLVIDANFRRPAQHRLLGVRPMPGLVDVLSGSTTVDQAIARAEDVPVDVLTVGDPARAVPELLDGPVFRELLQSMAHRYEVILIDAPPALITAEASMLTKAADAVLLVARALGDKKGMISRAGRELQSQRAKLLGIVLNGARAEAGGYFRQNYQAFYRYRNGDGAGANKPVVARA